MNDKLSTAVEDLDALLYLGHAGLSKVYKGGLGSYGQMDRWL